MLKLPLNSVKVPNHTDVQQVKIYNYQIIWLLARIWQETKIIFKKEKEKEKKRKKKQGLWGSEISEASFSVQQVAVMCHNVRQPPYPEPDEEEIILADTFG